MEHYIPADLPQAIKDLIAEHKLNAPMFEGQGCSQGVGSDCYGYYITKIKSPKLIGLVNACSKFEKCWEDGSMECTMPENKTPQFWITRWGKKWYTCDENGKNRSKGRPYRIGFNGAHAYRDPSF